MLKDNGMLKSASDEEVASIKKVRHMVCPKCKTEVAVRKIKFGENVCVKCGSKLVDKGMESASKTTGS